LICIYALYRMTQRDTVDIDEQAPMMPISPRTTAVLTELAIEQAEDDMLNAEEEAEEIYETHNSNEEDESTGS